MRGIEVASAAGAYSVVVGEGLLERLDALLDEAALPAPRAAVTDRTVAPLHGRRAAAAAGAGALLELEPGETAKTPEQAVAVCRFLVASGIPRGGALVAVGGGVLTDLAGLAAALHLRGIAWAAVPTTLLGMVDAAVGGKTGCNLPEGKNLVGAFWPPRAVVADVATLATLPQRELRAGLAEVVKAAILADRPLLDELPARLDGYGDLAAVGWSDLVLRAVRVKAAVVAADEREAGPRQALNLGHTVGHALEAATGYQRFLHGEAVAWGLRAALRLAERRGLLPADEAARLVRAVGALEPLPPIADLDLERVLEHLGHDKKRGPDGVAWVLPAADGVRLDQRMAADEVRAVLRELGVGGRPAGVR